MICNNLCPIFQEPWIRELCSAGIKISDTEGAGPIEHLLGADVAMRFYTGKKHVLRCGLIAIETSLGWTLMGKIPLYRPSTSVSMSTLSLLVKDASIADLRELNALGIGEVRLRLQPKIFLWKL